MKKVIPKGMKIKFATAGEGIKPEPPKQAFDFHSVTNAVQIEDHADSQAHTINQRPDQLS